MVCPWTEDTETHHCPISSPSLNISEKSDLDTWTGYKADGVCVCMSKLTDISYTVIEGANHLIRKPYRAYVSGIFFSPSIKPQRVFVPGSVERAIEQFRYFIPIRKIYQTAWLL